MLNKRKPCVKLTNTNIPIIPLHVAAERAAETGAFMLSEKSGISSYESDSVDIPYNEAKDVNIGKIDAALRGLDLLKEAQAERSAPAPETPAPAAPETPAATE